jgi:O-antigen/teichoic acid export membrane protein
MRALQEIVRNFSVVAVSQAITWTAALVFTIAQARYLDPARFGELSVALSYSVVLGVVLDFGLSTKLARDVARWPATAGQALVATLVLRVALWCVAMPLLWATTVILGYHADLQATILIIGGGMLFSTLSASLGSYFQGREEFLVPSLSSIAQRGLAAMLGVTALALGQGIVTMAIVFALANLVQLLVLIPAVRRRPVSSTALERGMVLDMFRGSAILGLFWILGTFYYNVDMLILQRLSPPETVASYAAAYRIFNAALMVVGFASGAVLYPVLSRLSVGSRDGLLRALERSFTFFLACGVFIAVTLFVAADQVVTLLFPAREYGEAATALRLLIPGLVAIHANGIFFLTLLGMGFERRLLVMAAVLAVLNPLANVLAIPSLQQNGAALVTSATEAIVLVWVLAATPRDLRLAARPSVVVKILVAAAAAGACMWVLRDRSLLIAVPLSGIVYATVGLALGTVPADDLRTVWSLLGRMRPGARHLDGTAVVSPSIAER